MIEENIRPLKHCNEETYGSMSFLAIYILILFGISVIGVVSFLLI